MITFPEMSIFSNFSRIFKIFGNLVMPQPDKNNTSKCVGMLYKFVSKLAGDILLPERSRYNKDFSEEKSLRSNGELVFRKERSRCFRLMSFEIGSMIFPSKWLFPRFMCWRLNVVVDQLSNSIEPVRSFPCRLRYVKDGIVRREEGRVPESWL